MDLRQLALAGVVSLTALTLAQCGAGSPTSGPTPPIATPTPTPTPTPSTGLPPGMPCNPTPPPILRMHLKVHDDSGDRNVLDSKPLVKNVNDYCDRVGCGSWKFCETRPEGHPERVACDYLVTGKAEDTGRWGPTWFYGRDLCAYFPADCANHPTAMCAAHTNRRSWGGPSTSSTV